MTHPVKSEYDILKQEEKLDSTRKRKQIAPCPLNNSNYKPVLKSMFVFGRSKPLKIAATTVEKQYTMSSKQALQLSEAERVSKVPVEVRFMCVDSVQNGAFGGQLAPPSHRTEKLNWPTSPLSKIELSQLHAVASDVCALLHIRQANVAKTVGQYTDLHKRRMTVQCKRKSGQVVDYVLTVLTFQGIQRLLQSTRSPNVASVRKFLFSEIDTLCGTSVWTDYSSHPHLSLSMTLNPMGSSHHMHHPRNHRRTNTSVDGAAVDGHPLMDGDDSPPTSPSSSSPATSPTLSSASPPSPEPAILQAESQVPAMDQGSNSPRVSPLQRKRSSKLRTSPGSVVKRQKPSRSPMKPEDDFSPEAVLLSLASSPNKTSEVAPAHVATEIILTPSPASSASRSDVAATMASLSSTSSMVDADALLDAPTEAVEFIRPKQPLSDLVPSPTLGTGRLASIVQRRDHKRTISQRRHSVVFPFAATACASSEASATATSSPATPALVVTPQAGEECPSPVLGFARFKRKSSSSSSLATTSSTQASSSPPPADALNTSRSPVPRSQKLVTVISNHTNPSPPPPTLPIFIDAPPTTSSDALPTQENDLSMLPTATPVSPPVKAAAPPSPPQGPLTSISVTAASAYASPKAPPLKRLRPEAHMAPVLSSDPRLQEHRLPPLSLSNSNAGSGLASSAAALLGDPISQMNLINLAKVVSNARALSLLNSILPSSSFHAKHQTPSAVAPSLAALFQPGSALSAPTNSTSLGYLMLQNMLTQQAMASVLTGLPTGSTANAAAFLSPLVTPVSSASIFSSLPATQSQLRGGCG